MEDLIKRSDAIDELMHIIPYKRYHNGEYVFLLDKKECLVTINAIPSADTFEITKKTLIEAVDNAETVGDVVENIINRPRGTYTNSEENVEWYATEATCNLCGKPWMGARNFCPNCGIRMKGAVDETD